MVLWSVDYLSIFLLPLALFYIIFLFDFFLKKKDQSLFFLTWNYGLMNYYFLVFFFLNILFVSTGSYNENNFFLLYYVLPLLGYIYIYIITHFFKKIILFIPIYMFILHISIPIIQSNDFFMYFILIESISIFLGFIFLKTSFSGRYVNALFNLILLNFLNLILLISIYIFFLYFYGTSNLFYISILYNDSACEKVFFFVASLFILLKLGQIPIFFYKKNIYVGLDFYQVIFYIIVYTIFIFIPSITMIWFFFYTIGYYYAVSVFIFFFILNIFILFNNYSKEDFLVISSALFILFLLLL